MLGKFILVRDYLVSKFGQLLPFRNSLADYVLTGVGSDTCLKQTFGAYECLIDGITISLDMPQKLWSITCRAPRTSAVTKNNVVMRL